MTVFYLDLCYNKVFSKGTALYFLKSIRLKPVIFRLN